MAVQQEIKSQLAKLLATEDIVVEHRSCETAQFNVHTRVLTLPLWEKASNEVYDMLVGHEVGHALYTPDEWDWQDEIPHQFMNVVEDARIEKLIKRKYMGLAKTFYKAYNELDKKDFFQLDGEDVDNFNLADRVNLYYKIGSFLDVPFTDAEKEIVDLIGKCETFADTKKAAKLLYEYCKEELKKEKEEARPDLGEDNIDYEEQEVESRSVEQSEGEEGEEGEAQPQPKSEQGGQEHDGEMSDAWGEPEVHTVDALADKLQDLINENGVENVYLEIPKVNLETIIASNSDVHEEIDADFGEQQSARDSHCKHNTLDLVNIFAEADAEYVKFKKDAQKEVNYLVKEFECRKAASAYARAATSRTGVLDTAKIHSYKYNEDIFKKITVLPDGKNHGLVFILDWSGSMQYVLQDTIKQLYSLIWFCRKVQIPFEVYAFSNEWHRPYSRSAYVDYDNNKELKPHYEAEEYQLSIENGFSLMNILTCKSNAKTLDHQMQNIWRVALSFRHWCGYQYPPKLSLSGTPLNETVIALHQLLPKFQKDNGVEKTQCIILTDGEASQIPYHMEVERHWESEPYMGTRNVNPDKCFLRDRKLGKVYKFGWNWREFTDVLLRNLKDSFPSMNLIGIRVLENREANRFMRSYSDEYSKEFDILKKDWSKNRSFTIKNSGYDAYFAMSSATLAQDAEFEPKSDSKADIKRAFVKSLKVKKLNKKVLSQFMELVA